MLILSGKDVVVKFLFKIDCSCSRAFISCPIKMSVESGYKGHEDCRQSSSKGWGIVLWLGLTLSYYLLTNIYW